MDSDKKPRFAVYMWAAGGEANMGLNSNTNNSNESYWPDTYDWFSLKNTSGDVVPPVHEWVYAAPIFLKLGSNDIINGVESWPLDEFFDSESVPQNNDEPTGPFLT